MVRGFETIKAIMINLTRAEILRALDAAPLAYVNTHDGETARCGRWSNVTPLGAVCQATSWNFHLADAFEALEQSTFLQELTQEWEACATSQLDLETATLYTLFYVEAFGPAKLQLNVEFI